MQPSTSKLQSSSLQLQTTSSVSSSSRNLCRETSPLSSSDQSLKAESQGKEGSSFQEQEVKRALTQLQRELTRDVQQRRFYGLDQKIRIIQKTLALAVRV